MRKPKTIKLIYHYIEPKTPQEKAEQQQRLDDIFDIIFKEAIKHMKDKQKKVCYNPVMEEKAKQILQKILYITIATVNKEGQPWNSPVYSAFDENYNFYWASDQNGQHSRNINDNPNVFLVIYDSTAPEGTGEGVYVKAKAQALTDEQEILHALKVLDERVGKTKERNAKEFLGNYPRRVYKAVPEKFWMNGDGNVNGNYIDIRIEVPLLNK